MTRERLVRKAVEMNPLAAEYRATLSEIDVRKGVRAMPADARGSPSRLAPCPCGSGRRYKDCCGRLENRREQIRRNRCTRSIA